MNEMNGANNPATSSDVGNRLGAALALALWMSSGAAVAASYDPDTYRFRAADLLPAKTLKGPNHTMQDTVQNKGYMNHYRITSPFGEFSVSRDGRVATIVQEINAIAELKQMSKAGVFAKSAAEAAQKPVAAAKQLAEQPTETLKGIPAGVGRLFARTKDTVEDVAEKSQQSGNGEGGSSTDAAMEAGTNLAKGFFGMSSAQRKLARDLKVDPYSTNTVLQAEIASMAKYAAAGSFGTKLVMPSIPGQGIVTGVSDLVWNLSPRDLKLRNEKALAAMGADAALVERFFDNPHYTPTDQTRFVSALESMSGAKGRNVVTTKGAAAKTRAEALMYSRMAEMLAAYHGSRSPVAAFVNTERLLPLVVTPKGAAVLAVPVDYLSWTERTEQAINAFGNIAAKHASGGKREIWVEGRVSDRAHAGFKKLDWVVNDRAFKRLGTSK